jgi:hypothetical protein
MRTLALFLLAGCAHCAPPHYDLPDSCGAIDSFPDVRGQALRYEPNDPCDRIREAILRSRSILVAAGFVSPGELDRVRESETLGVLSTNIFEAEGQTLDGVSYQGELIVSRTLIALAHEEIHEVRMRRGVTTEATHTNWESRGYYALSDFYEYQLSNGRACKNLKFSLTPEQRNGLIGAGFDVDAWEANPCPGVTP